MIKCKVFMKRMLSVLIISVIMLSTVLTVNMALPINVLAENTEILLHSGTTAKDGVVVLPSGGTNLQKTFDCDGAASNNYMGLRFTEFVDLSQCNTIEFDLVLSSSVKSWDLWKDYLKIIITVGGTVNSSVTPFNNGTNYTFPVPATLEEGTNKITLDLGYIKDLGVDLSNVSRLIIGSISPAINHWRMDGVTLEGSSIAPVNKSAYYNVLYGANNTNAPALTEDLTIAMKNVYGKYVSADYSEDELLSHGGYGWILKGATRLAAAGSGNDAVAYDVFDTAVDISNSKYIEFDFFISDIEAFRNEKNKNSGYNPYNSIIVRLNSQGRMTNTGGDPKVNITGFHTAISGYTMCDLVKLDDLTVEGDEYITESGWVHVKIPISSLSSATQTAALKSVKSFAIGFTVPDYPNCFTSALTQNYVFGFKNLRTSGSMVAVTSHCIDTEGNQIIGISDITTVIDEGSDYNDEIPEISGYNIKGFKVGIDGTLQSGKSAVIPSIQTASDIYYVYELNTEITDGVKIKFHDGTKAGTPSTVTPNTIGVSTIGDAADKIFDYQVEARQGWLNNIYLRLYEGVDLSGCNALELEFFLYSEAQTYDDWMPTLKFILTTGGTAEKVLSDGNHYSIPVPATLKKGRNIITLDLSKAISDGADLSNVTRLTLESFDGTLNQWENDKIYLDRGACAATAPVETCLSFGIRNVYGKYVAPKYAKGAKLISAGANSYMSTKAEGYLWLRPVVSFNPISVSGNLEFDYYISNLDAIKKQKDIETGEDIFTGIFAQVNIEGGDVYDIPLYIDGAKDNKITQSGWTHIVIPIDDNIAWKNMSSFGVYIGDTSKSTVFETNFTQAINNIAVTDYTELNQEIDGVLLHTGGYSYLNKGALSDSANAKYEIINAPLDGSEFHTIEFDMFISDYQSLVNDENFNGFRIRVDTQLIGTAQESLIYYYNYTAQVKKNGWNHIVIPFENTGSIRRDFLLWVQLQVTGTSNFKAPKSYILAYKNIIGKEKPEYDGPITSTQPSKPDKSALYITDCETMANDGQWTPASVVVDTYNKSEGNASIKSEFYEQPIRGNSFRFICNSPFRVAEASVFKFDIYVSDKNLLNTKSKMVVRIYSDSRGTNDYAEWGLDISALTDGWNSLSFDLNKAEITSDFNKGNVMGFYILCTESDFIGNEKVTIYLDNIRITDAAFIVEADKDSDYVIEDTVADTGDTEIDNTDGNVTDITVPKEKTVKKVRNVTQYNYTVAIIVIIVLGCMVLIVAGLVLLSVLKRNRRKI